MKMRKIVVSGIASIAAIGLFSGCSETTKEKDADVQAVQSDSWKMPAEPITLRVYQLFAALTDAEFQELIVKPIKAKYPNITLNLIRGGGPGTQPDQVVASGDFPDIIFSGTGGILRDLDVFEDLSGLVTKHKMDLNRFKPEVLDTIRESTNGKLTAFPFAINYYALFYNKDIFDKFGVPYPKDSMTWDDATALAKNVTRTDGGIQYRGINPGNPSLLGSQLAAPLYDKNTNKPLVQSDSWQKVYSTLKQMYEIPGNLTDIKYYGGDSRGRFLKERVDAMVNTFGIGMVSGFEEVRVAGNPMNWDMATSPTFKEAPNTSPGLNLHVLGISKASKNKDAAFMVISELMSDANQIQAAKYGKLSGQKNADIQKNFGANLEVLKNKNVNALFTLNAPKPVPYSKFNDSISNTLNVTFEDVLLGKSDINSALSKAHQTAEQTIKLEQSK